MICDKCKNTIIPEKIITIKGNENLCYDCYKSENIKVVCLDFDGVMAQYSGWKGPDNLGEPMPGIDGFLMNLINWAGHNYRIVVHTTRDKDSVLRWLEQYKLSNYIWDVTNEKIPAIAYIDDRAIKFSGDFVQTYYELINFKPHWK